jgi:hypothetical protein
MDKEFDLLELLRRSKLTHVNEAADTIEAQREIIEYWKARAEGRVPLQHCPTCQCTRDPESKS